VGGGWDVNRPKNAAGGAKQSKANRKRKMQTGGKATNYYYEKKKCERSKHKAENSGEHVDRVNA